MSLQGRLRPLRAARPIGLLLIGVLLLAACASNPPAPVEDRSIGDSHPAPRVAEPRVAPAATAERHRVERGDTLYTIAFRHGLDYREVARWNHIEPPYTIFVGRELRLTAPEGDARGAAIASAPPPPLRSNASPKPPTAPTPSAFEPVAPTTASAPALATPAAPTSAAPPRPSSAPIAATSAGRPTAPAPATAAPVAPTSAPPAAPASNTGNTPSGDVPWRWPADGAVVGSFVPGDQTKQGVDIAGKSGDQVRASADGVVVYSGNGLIGYGELIIIKHNPSYLSAYGHNRKRLVQEGDKIKAGQAIAEMGSSGASRDLVHFEIRKNGKPVNPLDYLPTR